MLLQVVTEGLRQFKTLVVFDFDWSLVEENSDTWVLDELGATHIFKRLKATGTLSHPLHLHQSIICSL